MKEREKHFHLGSLPYILFMLQMRPLRRFICWRCILILAKFLCLRITFLIHDTTIEGKQPVDNKFSPNEKSFKPTS